MIAAGPRQATQHAPSPVTPRRTRPPAPDELYDAHARDLVGLAVLLLGDRSEAEAVVVHVLREAGPRRRGPDDRDDRRCLSWAVYLLATRSRLGPDAERDGRPTREALRPRGHAGGIGVTALSEQQRAVLALSLHGGHSHNDSAALLALPTSVVDELLRSGLHRVSGGCS